MRFTSCFASLRSRQKVRIWVSTTEGDGDIEHNSKFQGGGYGSRALTSKVPVWVQLGSPPPSQIGTEQAMFDWIRTQIIGGDLEISTPFGRRRLLYADYTASGRSLQYVEDLLRAHVLPFYGNTHTEDSMCGQRTTHFVQEAAEYVKNCLKAGPQHKILFCGAGCTAAVKRLQEVMGITVSGPLRSRVVELLSTSEKWVVFVGPYEHHSNILTWQQSIADVIEVPIDDSGGVDLEFLESELKNERWEGRPKLGSFSAASNVTGILTDTRSIAKLLHKHGAVACFDFAASAPYIEIDMRPGEEDGYDAIFLSPHKFMGGPGSSGVLLFDESLYALNNHAPTTSGGGTVTFVNSNAEDTLHHDEIEERENAGTPAILQTIRGALAFWVKECVGVTNIERKERELISRALAGLAKNPRLEILGDPQVPRLAILSFLVRPSATEGEPLSGKPLDGAFVVRLLNDLFGIQARGGCACAAPYMHRLLKIDPQTSQKLRRTISKGFNGIKPGSTRLNLAYFLTEAEFDFILSAIEFIADHAIKFLAAYDFDWRSGAWTFRGWAAAAPSLLAPLSDSTSAHARTTLEAPGAGDGPEIRADHARYLEDARKWKANNEPDLTAPDRRMKIDPSIDHDSVAFVT